MVMEAGDPSGRSREGMGVELKRSQKDDRRCHSLQGTPPARTRNCLAIAVNRFSFGPTGPPEDQKVELTILDHVN